MIEVLLFLLVAMAAVAIALLVASLRQSPAASLRALEARLENTERASERWERTLREEFANGRNADADLARAQRTELANSLEQVRKSLTDNVEHLATAQREKLGDMVAQIENLRSAVERKLSELATDNAQKLDKMRETVDEKLQGVLEKRLGDSFRTVSERLEAVHKGLGEMQQLANGVGDLKRVLTNVKTRGTWGEIQLGALLEQMLAPEQFAINVATRPGSAERVEYAIRLPGQGNSIERAVWLPIDAKFPQEDYQRLVDASERADAEGVERAAKDLEIRIRGFAKDIQRKYVEPPHTTDFAILYLPTEGLYAEIVRRSDLVAGLQREVRIVIAGPTTLAALLNSLQMGFRTLAIEQRSSEIAKVLGEVKTEFVRFGDVMRKVKDKLDQASRTIEEDVSRRTRAIERKLRGVEALPSGDTPPLLTDVDDEPERGSPGA